MSAPPASAKRAWPEHVVRAGMHRSELTAEPTRNEHREHVEPWLTALFQAEHLALLVGSGVTTAVAKAADVPAVDMSRAEFAADGAGAVEAWARVSADALGRGEANIEDQIRAALELISGLRVLAAGTDGDDEAGLTHSAAALLPAWESAVDDGLRSFVTKVLSTERGIDVVLRDSRETEPGDRVRRLLGGFLLPFASRTATRERLHVFTTNYDRLIEYACDLLGLRIIDRFVGVLAPVFRSSRLGVDMHYNPPGIRGEPRYLEGVVRLTKLHGSIDWRRERGPSGEAEVQRRPLPFGAADDHPELPQQPRDHLLIYPNPAKDVETLQYPYAELFRDFAAAACQPNAVVVTYGYGFGDSHVNRVLRDMLSIPSTHLAIISYDGADGRVQHFCEHVAREEQVTLLVGPHFGGLGTLIEHYLPKPAIDRTTWLMMDVLNRRSRPHEDGAGGGGHPGSEVDEAPTSPEASEGVTGS